HQPFAGATRPSARRVNRGLKSRTSREFSFLLRNDWPELRSIIDKGLASITEPERRELRDYWFGPPILAPDPAEEALSLSPEEQAYLQRKGRLKLCVDPDWLPYEGLDTEGRHQGMSADFLQLFARRLGVELSVHPTRNWSETLAEARLRHCDLIALIKPTPERRTYLDFTAPYLSFPYVVATRNDQFFIEDIERKLDETFVVVRGYAVANELRRRYPAIRLLEVETTRDGLEKVRDGEAFGYIGATAAVAYALGRYGILGVKVAGRLPDGFDLGVATRNDEPLLGQVFQKAVDSLTPEEIRRIRDKWLAVDVQRVTDYTLLWWVLGAAAALLTLFAYWNRQLQRSRQQTEQALDELHVAQHQLEQQYRQLERLSVTDHLTQIHNRAKLDEVLEREIRRAGRHSIGVGVIMVDVDHFKLVNDTYGHQAGDQVLVAMAELLRRRVRDIDMVGRWGGEEFLVLCPGTDLEGVQTLAEHLRAAVAEHEFPVVGHKTASFGIATYRSGDSVESLVARADRALYAAKANGRNRVEEAPDDRRAMSAAASE
ncbi:diguanylate cyclase, partial [Allochromatium palmeri]|nr:diguanylate cyclase [Allochromatium palmeri]